MPDAILNPTGNVQPLPAGMTNPGQPAAPVVPPHNPMLSHLSNPPDPTEALKPEPAKPAPILTIPTAPAASTPATDLVAGFLNDPQVKFATSYIDGIAAEGKLDLQRALGKGFAEMDVRFIDEHYIKEVLKDKAGNFLETAKSMIGYIEHHRNAVINDVHTAAGGEASWDQAVEAFKRVASPEEQTTLRGLLDSTDSTQVKYAAARILEVARASGAVIQHSAAVLGKGGAQQGLSAKGYQDALAKEGRNVSEQRYQELRALRELGKNQRL